FFHDWLTPQLPSLPLTGALPIWPSPGSAPLRLAGARRWLNPRHGAALLALPYRPVWATTWEHDANEVLAPLLGLPELPVVEWPRPEERTSELQSSENLVCRLQLE